MRRSRRADADTPRDTPGDVEATRAAANAASSEEDSSYLSPLDKEPVRGTSGFNNMDNNKDYTSEYCYQPRSSHAPGEDTNASASVVTGRTRGDDDVGSVSTVCSDMESDLLDVALEACSFGSFALGAQDTSTSTPRRSKARAKAKAKKRSGAERRRRARARTDFALTIWDAIFFRAVCSKSLAEMIAARSAVHQILIKRIGGVPRH